MNEIQVDPDAFRAFERAAHDEVADGYRDFFVTITGCASEPLLDATSVRRGSRVLDVATGRGLLAARAAARGASRVIGIDIAPRMVALATAQYPDVEFRQGDAEDLPFGDESFDVVLSNFGIGHFPRPERALAQFARVAAVDGAVAVSWWDVPARHRLNGVFFDAFNEAHASPPPELPAGPPMFRFSDEEALADLLSSAGLDEVTVQACSFVHRLASPEALWNGIMGGTVLHRSASVASPRTSSAVSARRSTASCSRT